MVKFRVLSQAEKELDNREELVGWVGFMAYQPL